MAIAWLLVIASAIWVGIDAGKIMPSKDKLITKNKSGSLTAPTTPLGWAIGCILLWIIFFPWYLSKRESYQTDTSDTKAQVNNCLSCGKYYEGKPKFCPQCGAKTPWS